MEDRVYALINLLFIIRVQFALIVLMYFKRLLMGPWSVLTSYFLFVLIVDLASGVFYKFYGVKKFMQGP